DLLTTPRQEGKGSDPYLGQRLSKSVLLPADLLVTQRKERDACNDASAMSLVACVVEDGIPVAVKRVHRILGRPRGVVPCHVLRRGIDPVLGVEQDLKGSLPPGQLDREAHVRAVPTRGSFKTGVVAGDHRWAATLSRRREPDLLRFATL